MAKNGTKKRAILEDSETGPDTDGEDTVEVLDGSDDDANADSAALAEDGDAGVSHGRAAKKMKDTAGKPRPVKAKLPADGLVQLVGVCNVILDELCLTQVAWVLYTHFASAYGGFEKSITKPFGDPKTHTFPAVFETVHALFKNYLSVNLSTKGLFVASPNADVTFGNAPTLLGEEMAFDVSSAPRETITIPTANQKSFTPFVKDTPTSPPKVQCFCNQIACYHDAQKRGTWSIPAKFTCAAPADSNCAFNMTKTAATKIYGYMQLWKLQTLPAVYMCYLHPDSGVKIQLNYDQTETQIKCAHQEKKGKEKKYCQAAINFGSDALSKEVLTCFEKFFSIK